MAGVMVSIAGRVPLTQGSNPGSYPVFSEKGT